jgi:hypothetical protein
MHSVQSQRFSFPFAGLQAQPHPVAEIVQCGEPSKQLSVNSAVINSSAEASGLNRSVREAETPVHQSLAVQSISLDDSHSGLLDD